MADVTEKRSEEHTSELTGHCGVRDIFATKHSAEELHPIGEQR